MRAMEALEERIERETVIDADAERAWEAISDPSELERWLADEVEIDELVEGAPARFEVDGEERPGRVERVVEGRELAFTWEREPGEPSLVELELTPCVSGTRISVVETRLLPSTAPMMSGSGSGSGSMAGAGSSWDTALSRARELARLVLA